MLIDQENNIEHYPIVFNVFLLLPILEKILCIFYQTSPHITPEWHTKCIECTNIEFERQLFSYTLYQTCQRACKYFHHKKNDDFERQLFS